MSIQETGRLNVAAQFVNSTAEKTTNITKIEKDGVTLTEANTPIETGASRVFVRGNQIEVLDKGNYKLMLDGKKKTTLIILIPLMKLKSKAHGRLFFRKNHYWVSHYQSH